MKRVLLLLCLPPLVHAQALLAPVPTITITVHVCNPYRDTNECRAQLAQWRRAQDIGTLLPLLTEDFRNMGHGNIDKGLRDRIAVIAARLSKNKYD